MIQLCLSDRFRRLHVILQILLWLYHRRSNGKDAVLEVGMFAVGKGRRGIAIHLNGRNEVSAGILDDLVNYDLIRTAIVDHRVVVNDVGDVDRLRDDVHVLDLIDNNPGYVDRSKVAHSHKAIVKRADVVDTISPPADPDASSKSRVGRQGRPTDIRASVTPRNPGRRPDPSRNPVPAAGANPPAVMIRSPAPFFIRGPSPAGVIRVGPGSIRIRRPIA